MRAIAPIVIFAASCVLALGMIRTSSAEAPIPASLVAEGRLASGAGGSLLKLFFRPSSRAAGGHV